MDYEDGQEEPDSLKADIVYARIQLSNKSEKHFLKKGVGNSRKSFDHAYLVIVTFTINSNSVCKEFDTSCNVLANLRQKSREHTAALGLF
ncbi:hypothetical protein TNCV_5013951 [Trichonephila clavipes]|nr:hypothetical protein TNCV_5013951 [Trichonephila clavipes]